MVDYILGGISGPIVVVGYSWTYCTWVMTLLVTWETLGG